MGENPGAPLYVDSEEGPQRNIFLDTYHIQETPVTVEQWRRFERATQYDWAPSREFYRRIEDEFVAVTQVSWYDAMNFCRWLSKEMGKKISLPTEAQWEKACRGSGGQRYPWGNKKPDWQKIVAELPNNPYPVSVYTDHRSPCGCLGMWENVSEWCFDGYLEEAYQVLDNRNPVETTVDIYKVFRGGNVFSTGWPRCSFRGFNKPEFRHAGLGFRVVMNM